MCNFVAIKNTKIKSLCKPLEIEFKKNFFLCKLLRAVTFGDCFIFYACDMFEFITYLTGSGLG